MVMVEKMTSTTTNVAAIGNDDDNHYFDDIFQTNRYFSNNVK